MSQTRHSSRGITLVETCVTGLILGVLLAQAIPAAQRFKQKQKLQGIAQTLMTDLQQARSEAVLRTSAIQFRFSRHPGGSCYVMHVGKSGDCKCNDAGQAICADPRQLLKSQWLPSSQAATIQANVGNLSFQPRQGAVTVAGSIDIVGSQGGKIRHVVSVLGRVRSCSPDGSIGQMVRCSA